MKIMMLKIIFTLNSWLSIGVAENISKDKNET